MKINKLSYLLCFVLLGLSNSNVIYSAEEDEITKYIQDLTATRQELSNYKKKLLESPQVTALKKEITDLQTNANKKKGELSGLLDSKLNKNPSYTALMTKNKELDSINSELRKSRNTIENDPEIVKLRKEATELRMKALGLEQEARKLVDSKYNSDAKIKELLTKQSSLSNVPKSVADFRKTVANDNDVIKLKNESTEIISKITAKNIELRKVIDGLFSTDQQLNAMNAKIKGLNQKIIDVRKSKAVTGSQKVAPKTTPQAPVQQQKPAVKN